VHDNFRTEGKLYSTGGWSGYYCTCNNSFQYKHDWTTTAYRRFTI